MYWLCWYGGCYWLWLCWLGVFVMFWCFVCVCCLGWLGVRFGFVLLMF